MDEPKKSNKKSIAIVLLSILALAFAVLYFLKATEVEDKEETISTIELEKLQLKSDLQEMLIQYDTLTVQNSQLNAEMLGQQEQIRDMLKQIEKHKDDAWIIHKLKKEAATLRDIMKGYLVTIDSLNTLNIDLQKDKEFLVEELSQAKTKAQALEKEKEGLKSKVETGSVLRTDALSSVGIRVRNNGKQVEVNRANRTELIRTCATIAENIIAEPGKKSVYLRIISPEGIVLDSENDDSKRFDFEGVSGKYSVKRTFDYQNKTEDLCIFYTAQDDLPGGRYIVEMYESGVLIGKTELDLK